MTRGCENSNLVTSAKHDFSRWPSRRPVNRRAAAFLIAMFLGLLCVAFAIWERRAANHAVRVEFVGLTNIPSMGPQARLKVINLSPDLIVVQNYGYLDPGESGIGRYDIPAGTGSWRASVWWQRRDLGRFEMRMNHLHDRLVVAFGGPQLHRDPWLPLGQVSYSPEIQR